MGQTTVKDVELKHEGTEIILPVLAGKEMSIPEAILWLDRKQKEAESTVSIYESIPCSPLDGAMALSRAIKERYGWSKHTGTVVGVPVAVGETEQVPWGNLAIPGIDGTLQTSMDTNPPAFVLCGSIKKKHKPEIVELIKLTRKFLDEQSIYRGKAVRVSWEWERSGRNYNPLSDAPKFFSIDPDAEEILTFSERVSADLEVGLFALIEHRDECRKYQIPLKRGVLLYGRYGTGKTLTATVAALRSVKTGTTFVYLDSVEDLRRGLEFAAQYAPSVVFCEDIDRAMSGERSIAMDEVLNLIDGIDTKGKEIITVLTTNHIERINPALLRMGRIDTLIEVTAPDASAAEKLVAKYGRGLIADDADLSKVGKRLAGKIPAFIRETVERSKIAAIARLKGRSIAGAVTEDDLLTAAGNLETHDALLQPKKGRPRYYSADKMFLRVDESVEAEETFDAKFPEVTFDDDFVQ